MFVGTPMFPDKIRLKLNSQLPVTLSHDTNSKDKPRDKQILKETGD